jgi:cytoskeleton protein RodZ
LSNDEQDLQPELLAEQWGAQFKASRESLTISLEQAATDLNLPVEYIECLEKGELDGLPSMVFARGYIRSYAKLLGMSNADEYVSEFERIHGAGSSKGAIRPVSRVRQQVKMGDPVMKLFSWVFLLGIIGVSIWWWQTQYGGSLEAQLENVTGSEETAPADNAVVLENGTATLAIPALDDSPVDKSVIEEGAGSDASVQEEPQYLSAGEIEKLQKAIDSKVSNTTVENNAAPEVQLALTEVMSELSVSADFISECWVSIKDGDGKTLFNNLRGKGQSVNVKGKPPLSVLIGAADAVGSFKYNGEAFDLAPYSRKNVVRLSLPVSE